MQGKVSIVVPCYNKKDLIGAMLESVYNQVWDNIEVLLVNDGSTDGTREIIGQWEPKLKARGYDVIIIDQENGGCCAAVYAGLCRMTGDYFCLADCDDELYPEYVSRMAGWLDTHSDYEWAACSYYNILMEGGKLTANPAEKKFAQWDSPTLLEDILMWRFHTMSWACMSRMSYVRRSGMIESFCTERRATYEPCINIPLAALRGRLKFFDEPLYKYNQYAAGLSNISAFDDTVKYFAEQLYLIEWSLNRLNIPEDEKQRYIKLSRLMYNCRLLGYGGLPGGDASVIKFAEETSRLLDEYFTPAPHISTDTILKAGYSIVTFAIATNMTKPVIIMPFTYSGIILYHAMVSVGVNVLGFWDNDAALEGESYDGKSITLPKSGVVDATFVISLNKYESEIKSQLEELGYSDFVSLASFTHLDVLEYRQDISDDLFRIRPKAKSSHFRELWLNSSDSLSMFDDDRDESLKKLFELHVGKRRILIIAPNLDVNGVSIALRHAARFLLDNGDMPLVFSQYRGPLLSDFLNCGIPVLIDYKQPSDSWFMTLASQFDLVFLNTIMLPCIRALNKLNQTDIPVLWWIHEPESLFNERRISMIPKQVGTNIHTFCVGEYSQNVFKKYIPGITTDSLLYGIEDFYDSTLDTKRSVGEKTTFMTICSIEHRKGQDILCSAIRLMDEELRSACEFFFVGLNYDIDDTYDTILALKNDFPGLVTLTGMVDRGEIRKLLYCCDCMVCASRDDPMPIFLTEAMIYSKICICSENAGTSGFIEDGVNGFVYTGNSAENLSEKLTYVAEHFDELGDMGDKSREIYESHFSLDVFRKNLLPIIDELIKETP